MKENKLIVALDVSSFKEAETLVKVLSPAVKLFKVGKELFTAEGPRAVEMIHAHGAKVFLDLKFHDIPNTVASACEAAAKMGVFMLNVHTLGGKQMMVSAVQALHKTAQATGKPAPILLGVTVLTSMTENDLREVGIVKKLDKQVEDMAELAKICGLDGVVASGQEIEAIRKVTGSDFKIVTPGVRPAWAAHGDQKRIVTPREAMERGASFIVVGRPITQSQNPLEAAEKILKEM